MPVSAEPKGVCSAEKPLGNSDAADDVSGVITRTLSNVKNPGVESGLQL